MVMESLWRKYPQTTSQVVASLAHRTDWKPKTIHTLLRRLVVKGALTARKENREFVFDPRVTEAECQRALSRSFLARFFGGDLKPFLARFVEDEKLSPHDIRELKRILEGKKK